MVVTKEVLVNKQFILIMADTVRKDMLGCYGNAGDAHPQHRQALRAGDPL